MHFTTLGQRRKQISFGVFRVAETHGSYDALEYRLFCQGRGGYHLSNVQLNYIQWIPITGKRSVSMSFYVFRLMAGKADFNYTLKTLPCFGDTFPICMPRLILKDCCQYFSTRGNLVINIFLWMIAGYYFGSWFENPGGRRPHCWPGFEITLSYTHHNR